MNLPLEILLDDIIEYYSLFIDNKHVLESVMAWISHKFIQGYASCFFETTEILNVDLLP